VQLRSLLSVPPIKRSPCTQSAGDPCSSVSLILSVSSRGVHKLKLCYAAIVHSLLRAFSNHDKQLERFRDIWHTATNRGMSSSAWNDQWTWANLIGQPVVDAAARAAPPAQRIAVLPGAQIPATQTWRAGVMRPYATLLILFLVDMARLRMLCKFRALRAKAIAATSAGRTKQSRYLRTDEATIKQYAHCKDEGRHFWHGGHDTCAH
jgi:hypothetical protein